MCALNMFIYTYVCERAPLLYASKQFSSTYYVYTEPINFSRLHHFHFKQLIFYMYIYILFHQRTRSPFPQQANQKEFIFLWSD